MFFLYQFTILLLIIFSPIILLYRIIIGKEHKQRFKEKFALNSKKRNQGKLIWFHGASVGEILSIVPLIQYYEKNKKINQILITSSTLSSSNILSKYKFKKTVHQFYPIDYTIFTNKFLNTWKPSIAIFVDSEIWPSMFKNLRKKKIPLILLNARLTKKTIARWLKIKSFTKNIFNKITIAFPQNIETNNFLKKIKVTKINFIGNLKFAQHLSEKSDRIENNLKIQFKDRKIWVASSTHYNEEIICAQAHILLKNKIDKLLTIIIPRHIHRVPKIVSEIKKLGLKVKTRTSGRKNLNNIDIYIVDTFGETKKFHKLGSSVFLGGSFVKKGGQNPLEAARYGAKIIHGPYVDNFKDVYNLLENFKISKKVFSSKTLASSISFNKNSMSGNRIKNLGEKILKKTIKELNILIRNELKKT
tara:strand:+ start:556 stop:1806 length:1251 start_codon:yes stop_codon:yes gene_type:complete